MEEEKAAAYYDELTRKGGGAARFKQGLGFSSTPSDDAPSRSSALPSSSSFMSNFVKASSPTKENEIDKKTQIENIQNKLKKKEPTNSIDLPIEKTRVRVRDRRRSRSRSRDKEREREKDLRRGKGKSKSRSRSRSLERRRGRSGGGSDEERERSRRRYRSPSKERRRERSRERRRRRRRSRSRSLSDGEKRHGRNRSFSPVDRRRSERGREGRVVKKEGNGAVDYAKLIDGYDKMTPAERVKAKMKLQLSQTAEKDTKMGTDSQWERFDFNKDAPVDDAEIEAADDDAALVKQIGKTFRFTSLEGKREDEIKNAHDDAMCFQSNKAHGEIVLEEMLVDL
ncbi:Nipped-B-like protein B [Bienertia sinuspersici]